MFAGIRIPLDQPWSSISKFEPIYPREGELPMPIMAPRTSILDVLRSITTPPPVDQPLSSLAKVPITRQIACPQCGATLQIVPPSPEMLIAQAFQWLTCPVCGYAKLVQVPTGGYVAEVVSKMKPPPPMPGEGTWKETIRQQKCATCGSLLEITSQALAPQYIKDLICPVCGKALGVKGISVKILKAPSMPNSGSAIHFVDEALEQYEEKIIELEEALRTAQAAEFYTNPYGTIEAQGLKLLTQLEQVRIPSPPVQMIYPLWWRELTNRKSNLINRVRILITNCRTAAKQRKPIPTYQQATGEQQTQWITDTTRQLRQQGLPLSDVRFLYPRPGETSINGRARLPVAGGISPLSELFTDVPVSFPDYSVGQRLQTVAEQEAWQLGEPVAPVEPKKITPLLILAGLGVATAGVWYYKKKKKKA